MMTGNQVVWSTRVVPEQGMAMSFRHGQRPFQGRDENYRPSQIEGPGPSIGAAGPADHRARPGPSAAGPSAIVPRHDGSLPSFMGWERASERHNLPCQRGTVVFHSPRSSSSRPAQGSSCTTCAAGTGRPGGQIGAVRWGALARPGPPRGLPSPTPFLAPAWPIALAPIATCCLKPHGEATRTLQALARGHMTWGLAAPPTDPSPPQRPLLLSQLHGIDVVTHLTQRGQCRAAPWERGLFRRGEGQW
jgi:hypothetical protein